MKLISVLIVVYLSVAVSKVLTHQRSKSHLKNEDGSWKTLYTVIKNNGTTNDVRELISNGADLNLVDGNDTPLMLAASKVQEKAAEMLIKKGANVNITNNYMDNAPLHIATYNGLQTIIDLLIQHGADVNATNRGHKDTPLTYAAEKGNERAVKLLLDKGAFVNAINKYKKTPIILAANGGFENIVELLIQKGADINTADRNGLTALILSVGKGLDKAVDMLIKNGADASVTDQYGDTALILAIEKSFVKIAKLLIDNRADVNALNSDGNPILTMAIDKGLESVIESLIQKGVNVNVTDNDGNSALILAAKNGLEKSFEMLIGSGAPVNVTNQHYDTAIILASDKGLDKAVELLIKHKANVNAANDLGNTALILAAKKGNEKIVDMLIKNGANVNAVNNAGDVPLNLAAAEGRDAVVRLLLQSGADPTTRLSSADLSNVANKNGSRNNLLNGNVAQRACDLYTNLTLSTNIGYRISNGELAELGEFPWMAALGYLSRKYKINFSCGGTLISDVFVLTAAHCVKDIRRPVVVRLGKISLTDEDGSRADNHNIREIIRHPKFSITKKKNDIALIRLIDRIWFTEFIRPACLQTDLRDEDVSVLLTVTGWGQTSSAQHSSSNELLKTEIRTVPLEQCNSMLGEYNKDKNLPAFRNGISESQYCAYDIVGKRDSCQGDSGGPLQIIPANSSLAKVVGVVSFGIVCGSELPSVYTRVAFYADWIASYVWPNGEIKTPLININ